MKKNKALLYAGILCILAFTAASCKSTPKTVEPVAPAPVETVVAPVVEPVKPVDDALTALRDRMESLRNECLKYKLDAYRAAEWAVAETSRAAGLKAYGTDYDLAKTSFETAIAQYEAIKTGSFEQITVELEASIIKAREDAIAAGANEYYPEQFALADAAAREALALKEAGDLTGGYDKGQIALMRYQTLSKGMQALALKQKIDNNGFEQYDPENYAFALVKYDESAAAFGTADAASLEAASVCVSSFEKVNNAGFKVWSEDLVLKVDEIRLLCDAIKAEKSMKAAYGDASAKYSEAAAFGSDGNWESAYASYAESTTAFTDVLQEVTLKRNMADVAIAAAKDKQAQSTDLAARADEVAPLPEDAEGFSEEPVLIQDTVSGEEPK